MISSVVKKCMKEARRGEGERRGREARGCHFPSTAKGTRERARGERREERGERREERGVTFLQQRRKVTKGAPLKEKRCCKIQQAVCYMNFGVYAEFLAILSPLRIPLSCARRASVGEI